MRLQLLAIPVAIIMMLLAVILGMFRLLSIHGVTATPLGFLQVHHGEMIVFGFLAPLILVERYLGAKGFSLNPVIHAMPLLVVGGAMLKLVSWFGGPALANTLGSIAIAAAVVIHIYLLYAISRQSAQALPFHYMALGAAVLLVGALLNISRTPLVNPAFTLLLVSFPIITILGERVELSRFLSPKAYKMAWWGLWFSLAAVVMLIIRILAVNIGLVTLSWAVLIGVSTAFLLSPELKLIKLGRSPLHKYLGWHLGIGYFWLFFGIILLIWSGEQYPFYDAGTHAIAIGFVFSMIMAHAPVIAPVIINRMVAENKLGYYPVALLGLSVIMRVSGHLLKAAGAEISIIPGLSGVVSLLAVIAFVIMIARSFRPA